MPGFRVGEQTGLTGKRQCSPCRRTSGPTGTTSHPCVPLPTIGFADTPVAADVAERGSAFLVCQALAMAKSQDIGYPVRYGLHLSHPRYPHACTPAHPPLRPAAPLPARTVLRSHPEAPRTGSGGDVPALGPGTDGAPAGPALRVPGSHAAARDPAVGGRGAEDHPPQDARPRPRPCAAQSGAACPERVAVVVTMMRGRFSSYRCPVNAHTLWAMSAMVGVQGAGDALAVRVRAGHGEGSVAGTDGRSILPLSGTRTRPGQSQVQTPSDAPDTGKTSVVRWFRTARAGSRHTPVAWPRSSWDQPSRVAPPQVIRRPPRSGSDTVPHPSAPR